MKSTAVSESAGRLGATEGAGLSVSAYAILGLLAIGARSGYELASQMERTVKFFWPRASSKLYEAPKTLVANGLARARREHVGRRARTIYTITPAGRRALRDWLGRPGPAALDLESEAILRVWFGMLGTKAHLLDAIDEVGTQAQANLEWGMHIAREYLADQPPAGRGHVSVLVFRFLWDFNEMLERWAAWARSEVEPWEDVQPTEENFRRATRIMRDALVTRDRRRGRRRSRDRSGVRRADARGAR